MYKNRKNPCDENFHTWAPLSSSPPRLLYPHLPAVPRPASPAPGTVNQSVLSSSPPRLLYTHPLAVPCSPHQLLAQSINQPQVLHLPDASTHILWQPITLPHHLLMQSINQRRVFNSHTVPALTRSAISDTVYQSTTSDYRPLRLLFSYPMAILHLVLISQTHLRALIFSS